MNYRFGSFEIDVSTRELRADGRPVDVEPKVFDLLAYLLANRDRAVSKDEILETIWPNQIVTEAALSRAIMKARRAVGDDASQQAVIRTLHGHGFRFIAGIETPVPADTEGSPASAARPAARPRKLGVGIVAGGIAAIVAAALFISRDSLSTLETGTLAVLPVNTAIEADDSDWVRLGIMSLLRRMLEESGIDVAPDRQVLSATGDEPLAAPPDANLFRQIRDRSGADAALHTTLELTGGLHRMTAVITYGDGKRARRVIVGESPAAVAADMANVIAGMVRREHEDGTARFSKVSTDPFVNELYARALDLELRGDIAEAREMFRVAANQEPELFWLRYEIALCTRDLKEHDEAERMFGDLLEEARDAADARAIVATLNSWGRQKLGLNQFADANALLDEALASAGERSLANERAVVLVNLALVDSWQGNDDAAALHYEDALAAYAEAGVEPAPAFLNNYAGLLARLGKPEEAKQYAGQAVAGFRVRGQRRFEAPSLNRLARIHRSLGDIDRAIELHQQARSIYVDLGDARGELSVLGGITSAYRESGDLTRALLSAEEMLERVTKTPDDHYGHAVAHIQTAYVLVNAGEHAGAIDHFELAAERFAEINERRGIRSARIGVAFASLELGDSARAHAIGQEILAADTDNESAIARGHWVLGHAHLADDSIEAALQAFALALDYARSNGDRTVLGYAASGMAEAYIAAGDADSAAPYVEEIRPFLETDHDFSRLDARLKQAQGETAAARDVMLALRSRAGEGWNDEDDALLEALRRN